MASQLLAAGDCVSVSVHRGRGPCLVFVHGNSLDSASLAPAARALPGHTHVLVDLPGHGESPPSGQPSANYSVPGLAQVLAALCNELALDEVILVGHSLGGHVAFEAAPEVAGLAGLVAYGAPPLASPADAAHAFAADPVLGLAYQAALDEEEARTLLRAMLAGDQPDAQLVDAVLRCDPQARAELGASLGRGELADEVATLRGLDVPVALLLGERETLVRRAWIDGLDLTLWRGGVQTVPGAAHIPRGPGLVALAELLEAFVGDLR